MRLMKTSITLIALTLTLIGCSGDSEDENLKTSAKEKYRKEQQEKLEALANQSKVTNQNNPITSELNSTRVNLTPDSFLDAKVENSLAETDLKVGMNIRGNTKAFLATGRGIVISERGTDLAHLECIATSGLQALKTFNRYTNSTVSMASNHVQSSKNIAGPATSSLRIMTPNGVERFAYSSLSKTETTVIQGKPADKFIENNYFKIDSGSSCSYESNGDHVKWNCDIEFIASVFDSGLQPTDNALAINAIHSESGKNQCVTAFVFQFD